MSEMLLLDHKTQSVVESSLPDETILNKLGDFFSVFSDQTRLKILSALSVSELCVTDLSRILCMNQTTISHQLRFLKGNGVVRAKRHGKVIFYSLSSDVVNEVLLSAIEFLGY